MQCYRLFCNTDFIGAAPIFSFEMVTPMCDIICRWPWRRINCCELYFNESPGMAVPSVLMRWCFHDDLRVQKVPCCEAIWSVFLVIKGYTCDVRQCHITDNQIIGGVCDVLNQSCFCSRSMPRFLLGSVASWNRFMTIITLYLLWYAMIVCLNLLLCALGRGWPPVTAASEFHNCAASAAAASVVTQRCNDDVWCVVVMSMLRCNRIGRLWFLPWCS